MKFVDSWLLKRPCGIAFLVACFVPALTVFAADDPLLEDLRALQGKWVRTVNSPNGPVQLLKEHRDQTTTLTATNALGTVLYAHQSEFKLERNDKVRLLTFSNRIVIAGPQQGQTVADSVSFVYRVANGQFIEAYGLLENDPNPPSMIVWKRPE